LFLCDLCRLCDLCVLCVQLDFPKFPEISRSGNTLLPVDADAPACNTVQHHATTKKRIVAPFDASLDRAGSNG
jgi:hypothetical protein